MCVNTNCILSLPSYDNDNDDEDKENDEENRHYDDPDFSWHAICVVFSYIH